MKRLNFKQIARKTTSIFGRNNCEEQQKLRKNKIRSAIAAMHGPHSIVRSGNQARFGKCTVKILKCGTPQAIAIIVLKIEKFDVTLH